MHDKVHHRKVLHLASPTGYYGAERWIVALARNIDNSKVVCDVAVTVENNQHVQEFYERISKTNSLLHKLCMKSRFDLSVVDDIVKLVDDGGYSVIHSHGYKSDILALFVRRKRQNIILVSTPHGFGKVADIKLKLFHYLGIKALRYFDIVAPLSPALCDQLTKASVSPEKVTLIPNGVDLSEIPIMKTNNKDAKTSLKVGFVGRLVAGKQVDHLLFAFDEFWKKHKSAQLHIVGEGDQKEYLRTIAARLHSSNNIYFHGYVEDRFSIMVEWDAIVLPSLSEGIPRSLMEAMVIGVPVIAYDIDGVNLLVEDNVSGILCKLNDWKLIAHALVKITSDIVTKDSLVRNARQRIESQFSASVMARSYEKLYSEIVSVNVSKKL